MLTLGSAALVIAAVALTGFGAPICGGCESQHPIIATSQAVAAAAVVPAAKPTQGPKPTSKPKPTPRPTATPAPTTVPTPTTTRAPVATARATPAPSPAMTLSAHTAPPSAASSSTITGSAGPTQGQAPTGGLRGTALWSDLAPLVLLLASIGGLVLLVVARRRGTRLEPAGPPNASQATTQPVPVPDLVIAPRSATTGDEHLPRWRRPSVTAARFISDRRPAEAPNAPRRRAPALVFDGPIEGILERMLVRYDGVPLLDRPDEVMGRSMGDVDSGDEVGILEVAETWARVVTPAQVTGWLPTMTLTALLDPRR
jgi:hypothetical protein